MTDDDKLRLAAQAEMDRYWMEYDEWYATQDKVATLQLIDILDCETKDGPDAIRSLDDDQAELVRRFALHVFRELALRNTRPVQE